MAEFPEVRLRRLRRTASLRDMFCETRLDVSDLVYPLFVVPGIKKRQEIPSMPGIYHLSADEAAREAWEIAHLGIPAVILFGLPETKDEQGTSAFDPGGVVQQSIAAIKSAAPDLTVITDICLCQYTSHGHCGVLTNGQVDNDKTLELLAKTALSHVQAGADMVAPSDMMDGRVKAIRVALDKFNFTQIPIMAYSAKYASAFYGPFREAACSAPQSGDRKSYQMNPANSREALREVYQDIEEGADIVIVKPALPYLDIIRRVREKYDHPVAAYNVSGEYSMLKAAAGHGWIDGRKAALEIVTAIKRAGADIIITYHAKEMAGWLAEEKR